MERRAFLGLLGGAAVAGPVTAKAAADSVLIQSGFPSGSAVIGAAATEAAPLSPPTSSAGLAARVMRWLGKNGIPDWKMHEIRQRADHDRAYGLDPDLAALVSVSGGWKARQQRKRNLDRAIARSISSIEQRTKRLLFEDKMRKMFGEQVEWYD